MTRENTTKTCPEVLIIALLNTEVARAMTSIIKMADLPLNYDVYCLPLIGIGQDAAMYDSQSRWTPSSLPWTLHSDVGGSSNRVMLRNSFNISSNESDNNSSDNNKNNNNN